jgi:uracil-DNA glycosylase
LRNLAEREQVGTVFPTRSDIFRALSIPLGSVKVLILGQDPYHGPGQAHGLSFSVLPGVPIPASLRNIRKELLSDLALGEDSWSKTVGTLTPWVQQGVLLLNTILTVEKGNPMSHSTFGWEDLTSRLLGAVLAHHADSPLVCIAWGKQAQGVFAKLHLGPKHCILASAHPSPLSATHGFFGSKPFSKANAHLVAHGVEPIVWNLC